jgi:hypothetical protein
MSGQVVEFFEIIVPRCANTYGVSPCTAEVGVTGDAKCFNCLNTCQDTDNFSEETAALRFAKPTEFLPRDIDIVGPWIKSIDHASATISLAENLGTRAVLNVVIEDHPHSDAGEALDKYQAERGYDPYDRGSFWPRLCARYPSFVGFECAWYIGEVGQTLDQMEKRTFYIESLKPPGRDGSVTISAKDALKFLDGDRAQIPVLSEGFLTVNISAGDGNFNISPSGAGADYPASGYIRLEGKEDCAYTRSGDTFTIDRGSLGTTASSHSAGGRVQLIKRYDSIAAADIINDAIANYTDLPAGYIPLAEWQLEDTTNLGTLFTFILGEPVGVGAFVSRVLEQCGSMMWDDALEKKLRFKVIKPVPTSADIISEANVIGQTFEVTDQPDKRVSRAQVYYGFGDPTKRRDDLANYRQAEKVPDDETAEGSEALYGSQAIRTILADGIAIGGGSVADRLGNLLVGRKQRPPKRYKWSMLRRSNMPQLGGGYFIDWRSLQDASGLRERVPVQIISAKVSATTITYTAEEMRFTDLDTGSSTDRVLLINFNGSNLNLRDIHDNIYPSTFDGVTVTFLISSTIGSSSTSLPAVNVGDWPVGFTPKLILSGRIQGKGGGGGDGAMFGPGEAGGNGGIALYTRHAINLDLSTGTPRILGGGGGGGGGGARFTVIGGGGGGGAGSPPGVGGSDGNGSASGDPGTADAGGPGGLPFVGAQIGGRGADPGDSGSAGVSGATAGGAGGSPGAAIDGVSFVTIIAGSGDIRGPQIN